MRVLRGFLPLVDIVGLVSGLVFFVVIKHTLVCFSDCTVKCFVLHFFNYEKTTTHKSNSSPVQNCRNRGGANTAEMGNLFVFGISPEQDYLANPLTALCLHDRYFHNRRNTIQWQHIQMGQGNAETVSLVPGDRD